MAKIFDYKCTFLDNVQIDDNILNEAKITFPNVHKEAKLIVDYAKLVKKFTNVGFVEVPFCHTVEAEAFGAIINYGDKITGPRVKEFAYKEVNEILNLNDIDFSSGRISEVIKAVKILCDDGCDVVYEITGPYTILNNLIDTATLFKTVRKDRELMKKVYNYLGNNLYKFIKVLFEKGVKYISFADSAAAVGIIGPKITKEYVEVFLYEFIKKLVELAKEYSAMILLCPRITFALYSMDLVKFNNLTLPNEMQYFEALKLNINKIKLSGQMCIKNRNYVLKPALIKEIVFTDNDVNAIK